MAWAGVTARFQRFHANLEPTSLQVNDAAIKQLNVRRCLQAEYYSSGDETPLGFVVGSWAKRTQVRPSNDIDILFPIPNYHLARFNAYSGNSQSILLQEVKNILAVRYPLTVLRGDGQVVQVKFESMMVEVVPAFSVGEYEYAMPDTHDGGRWKSIWPEFEQVTIKLANTGANGNVCRLVRMVKNWKKFKNVEIKSYIIELLASDFFDNYKYRDKDYFFFDWFIRDFFQYLVRKSGTTIYSPGNGQFVNVESKWLQSATIASGIAKKACDYECADFVELAGLEWVKIFGPRIPVTP